MRVDHRATGRATRPGWAALTKGGVTDLTRSGLVTLGRSLQSELSWVFRIGIAGVTARLVDDATNGVDDRVRPVELDVVPAIWNHSQPAVWNGGGEVLLNFQR
jgi:hypothetical protein